MANTIDSKSKRERLAPRREPYWARIEKGAYVGFRKLVVGEGTWIARWRADDGKQRYRALGHHSSFDAAVAEARQWFAHCTRGGSATVLTVAQVCDAYVKALETDGRKATAKDARGRFNRSVYGKPIGQIPLDKLKSVHVESWLSDRIDAGDDADDDPDPDDLRRMKDSANRTLATLKAALNRAYRQRAVSTDAAWRTVAAFPKVGARRTDAFLGSEQRKALLEVFADDMRRLATAALLTGARPGELAKLNVGDFDRRLGTLTLNGKTGPRTVAISASARAFFAEQAKGKLPTAPMLARADGKRWTKDAWKAPFIEARQNAGLSDAVVLYSLRHIAISEMILAGMDTFIVARLCGTSVQMIESNYGHLRHATVAAKLDRIEML